MTPTQPRPSLPKPSLPVRLANGVSRILGPLSPMARGIDPDQLLDIAERQTGLEDFGDPVFLEMFDLLCDSLNALDTLHPVGMAVLRIYLTDELMTRLQIEEAFKRHPEIADEPLEAPLFIIGLPRTGTTLLHRLLGAVPGHQTLTFWEGSHTVAPDTLGKSGPDKRRDKVASRLKLADLVTPQLKVVHELRLDGPEECLHLMNSCFISWIYCVQANVAAYRERFMAMDQTPAYRDLRRQLQLLQWQRGRRDRWVLKSPGHLFAGQALSNAFPDAQIVQTHRDMAETVGSACSLFMTIRSGFHGKQDLLALGQEVRDQLALGLARTREFRTDFKGPQSDVDYAALTDRPVDVVTSLLGDDRSETRLALEGELALSQQHKHGRHQYSLEMFGLSPDGLDLPRA